MRQETQHWNQIRANLEVVIAGVGQTGLTPLVAIQRLSDGFWLANGGGSWGAGFATNNMTAVDASNTPGVYSFAVPEGQLTYPIGIQGYRFKITETLNAVLEHVAVNVARAEWFELIANYTSAGTAGRMLHVILGMVHGNHRLRDPVFDSEGRMTECEIRVFANTTDANADTNALETFTMEMTYDGFGNLASLLSRN